MAAFFALARLGSTILLASSKWGSSERASLARRARPAAWIAPPGLTVELPTQAQGDPFDDADALVKFSSGSTGEPKAVRLTATALIAEARNIARTLGLDSRDRVHARVPLSHSYGLDVGLLAPLFHGAAVLVGDGFIPRLALRELEGASIFAGIPAMYRLFLETKATPSLASLRWALSSTAPLSPELVRRFEARFGIWIAAHYGASECGAITNHRPSEVAGRIESVGMALDGVRLRLSDANGRPVAAGEPGEVRVESDALARGLLADAVPTPFLVEPDGARLYRTADFGRLDAEGFLFLDGRLDELINVGGLKVSPLEVEAVLESHPAVREALVRGEQGANGEWHVIALCVPRSEISQAELLRHCHPRLSDHKRPRRVDLVDALPRGAGGKLDRRPRREGH